jgi:hypothetical protein
MNANIAPTDLTQRPPRSFHVRLGGFVILPLGFEILHYENGN